MVIHACPFKVCIVDSCRKSLVLYEARVLMIKRLFLTDFKNLGKPPHWEGLAPKRPALIKYPTNLIGNIRRRTCLSQKRHHTHVRTSAWK